MLYTCGRPITGQRYCVLGRETALQEVEWTKDGWPKLKGEGNLPSKTVEVEADGIQKRGRKVYYGFQDGKMPFEFRTLRVALEPGVGSGARKRLHRALHGDVSAGRGDDRDLCIRRQFRRWQAG